MQRHKHIAASYYRGADAIIFVYDVTDKHSFKCLQVLHTEAMELLDGQPVQTFLVGSKADWLFAGMNRDRASDGHPAKRTDAREVDTKEAAKFARLLNMGGVVECSSRFGDNVKEMFYNVMDQLVHGSPVQIRADTKAALDLQQVLIPDITSIVATYVA